jgi:hypothetical protein
MRRAEAGISKQAESLLPEANTLRNQIKQR